MKLPINKLVNNTGQIDGVPANPRTINKDDYQKLLKSLQDDPDFLNHKPLHVYEHNGKYIVLGGNQRLKALKELGHKDVPVTIYDPETPVEVLKRRIIVDNSTFGDYNFDDLANEWDDEPLDDWGVDLPDDWLKQDEVEEDEAPEVDESEPPKSKLGEIYQLGRHRIMCADSTVKENVEKLMNGEKADMVFTDPPYGIDIAKTGKVGGRKLAKVNDYSPIIGDNTIETAVKTIPILVEYSKDQIIWGGNYYANHLPNSSCWVVWDKNNTGNFADCELAWTSYNKSAKLYKQTWNGMIREGESEKRVHPTQKPVGLAEYCFKTFEPSSVLDVFLGSGSTLIACEQTDRTCFGMEISESYTDVVRRRYHKFVTGSEQGWENATPAI